MVRRARGVQGNEAHGVTQVLADEVSGGGGLEAGPGCDEERETWNDLGGGLIRPDLSF